MARDVRPLEITNDQARKFHLLATGLASSWGSAGEAIRHLGSIQMDPINVCGKMHDLVLRNRVGGYRRDGLLSLLYQPGPREFFEHYIPQRGVLVALPVSDYRFLARSLRERRQREGYGGVLQPAEKKLARLILRRIREEGPLGTSDFSNEARAETGWGTVGSLAKTTLDKLFLHGRILVARREKFRRLFDLPERLLPPEILRARPASPREDARWLVRERLSQRRLVSLSPAQKQLVVRDIQPVRINGARVLYCLKDDVDLFSAPWPSLSPTLLAPLDPLVYDRTVARLVWGFDYIWEVYTPPAKRVRGYYALPLLVNGELVGHVDPRSDRASGTLVVRTNVADEDLVMSSVRPLAAFLGLETVRLGS